MKQGGSFKGRQFTAEVILWAVRWYLMFPISYRDLELMLADRGVEVDHTTIFRWIQAYAPELEKRIRPHLRASNGSWRVGETYVKVKGRWMYLYRAVDSRGQTIDFLLSAKRDAAAAKWFFRKALGQPHTVNPRTITVDKNPACGGRLSAPSHPDARRGDGPAPAAAPRPVRRAAGRWPPSGARQAPPRRRGGRRPSSQSGLPSRA